MKGRMLMKAIKYAIIKIIILFTILAGVIVAYFVFTYDAPTDPTKTISTATLPVVTMKYQNMEINTLPGYTTEMQGQYMRDAIAPYEHEGTVELDIRRHGNVIAEISYEIRTVDTKRLIDANPVKSWITEGEGLNITLTMSGILKPDEEYLLILKVVTETHGDVYYYVHLQDATNNDINSQLAFVYDFSRLTISKQAADTYGSYLEYDASRDQSNLAYVNIKSSYENINWGNLQVTRETEPVVTIKEIMGNIGCYELQYKVRAKDEYDNDQFYNVTEYFRLRSTESAMYLDSYERHANQIFAPTTQSISSTRINLGIDDDQQIHYKTSPTGSYVSFVKEGSLFLLDMEHNKVTEIFSFEKLTEDDVRIDHERFDIEILSTDGDGNAMFLVYGYMAKGAHEGQVGEGLYNYNYKKNQVEELVFVPSDKPFDIFKDSVGKFAYLSEDNLLYFMIGNSIYTITMDSNEYMQLVTGLSGGNYIINEYNNILAWHENASLYDAQSIRVIDVDAKKDYTIEAAEGERLQVVGFVGNDLVYGTARVSEIHQDQAGNTIFPMYKLNVAVYDSEGENAESKVETYEKAGAYIVGVTISDNVMTLKRQAKDEAGNYYDIEDDKYVNKKLEISQPVEISAMTTELKKTEVVLKLAYTITAKNKLAVRKAPEICFVTANTLNLDQSEYVTDNYYVYGNGRLAGICSSVRDAIEKANELFGTVIRDDGRLFWARCSKPELVKLSDTTALVAKAYQSMEQVMADTDYEVTDVSGVDMSALLYFGMRDLPVIVWSDTYGPMILSAYSGYQGNIDTLAFTLCRTGEIIKLSYGEAQNLLQASQNIFYVLESRKIE